MKKIVGVVWKLPDKQQSQSSPFSRKLGWIGCAIWWATFKQLPGFFFCFNILVFIFFLNIKPLRLMPLHFCHLIFQLQVVCVTPRINVPFISNPNSPCVITRKHEIIFFSKNNKKNYQESGIQSSSNFVFLAFPRSTLKKKYHDLLFKSTFAILKS